MTRHASFCVTHLRAKNTPVRTIRRMPTRLAVTDVLGNTHDLATVVRSVLAGTSEPDSFHLHLVETPDEVDDESAAE